MGKKKSKKGTFENRLKSAIQGLIRPEKLLTPHDYDLWTLTYKAGKYVWVKIMGSDGLLLASRKTAKSGAKAGSQRSIIVGVVIQCEQATSQTKPNPFGKAAISQVPFGVWVDVKQQKGNVVRQRLDVVQVALVAPEPTAYKAKKKFERIAQNLDGVADLLVDTEVVTIPQGAGATAIQNELMGRFRGFLKGPGKPEGVTSTVKVAKKTP
jgi:hypothetical protein